MQIQLSPHRAKPVMGAAMLHAKKSYRAILLLLPAAA